MKKKTKLPFGQKFCKFHERRDMIDSTNKLKKEKNSHHTKLNSKITNSP